MLQHRLKYLAVAGLAVTALSVQPAIAQKSKDIMRFGINDPFSSLDSYHVPHEETGLFTRVMYGVLLVYDEHQGKFLPELAKSWKQIDAKTYEFELRDDVYFHSGNKFTSEDVKHTIEYIGNPKVKIRFKRRYSWVKEVEILGPYKLRIVAKQPRATALSSIAYRFRIYDSKIHKGLKTLADQAAYGRVSASSTGPYKLVSLDKKGVVIERFKKYHGSAHRRAPTNRVFGRFIPDKQSQKAELLTGGLDLMRDITADDERLLATNPSLRISSTSSKQIMYITMDAAGRSANKAMTDIRVRQALMKSIDRERLINTFVAGGKSAERPNSVCFKLTVACNPTTKPLGYDPAGAKKLLAAAGYANGLKIKLNAYAPIKNIAVAIAGDLRKVGINASIEPLPLMVYVKKRGAGKFTAFLGKYPTAAQPDTENLLNFFFGANRDYYKDPLINGAAKKGATEFDVAKRAAFYTPALDQVNKMSFIYPLTEVPVVFAHNKDVEIKPNLQSSGEIRVGDFFWK